MLNLGNSLSFRQQLMLATTRLAHFADRFMVNKKKARQHSNKDQG